MQKKKGFRGSEFNPAAAFISGAGTSQQAGGTRGEDYTHNTEDTDNTDNTPKVRSEDPTPYNANMDETKSRRLNLLIRPTLLEEFSKVAHMNRTSMNDLINRLIADCTEKEAKAIRAYNRMYGSDR